MCFPAAGFCRGGQFLRQTINSREIFVKVSGKFQEDFFFPIWMMVYELSLGGLFLAGPDRTGRQLIFLRG
jgi:hypothetical protein